MATANLSQNHTAPLGGDIESDYGSDLDDATMSDLISRAESQHIIPPTIIASESIEAPAILDDHGSSNPRARVGRAIASQQRTAREASVEIEYDESNRFSFSRESLNSSRSNSSTLVHSKLTHTLTTKRLVATRVAGEQQPPPPPAEPKPDQPDTRSPLQRFRTAPKKPLSVTDIISPAWCELQYWYNLTKYGRVRRTTAMKQGSSVHKVLEEQVHTEVAVETVSREDRFALRLWNIVQGLRTLRRTGMTRELEVWGLVEGEVVNGIIDQITVESPDEEAETELLGGNVDGKAQKGKKGKPLPADQRTLTEYLSSSQSGSVLEQRKENDTWLGSSHEKRPKTLYLVDVKTRKSKGLPSSESQLRPTSMQLMTYHRLFSALAANQVPADAIFTRYGVDPSKLLSDTFLAQMSQLDLSSQSSTTVTEEAGTDELLAHNTLTILWSLMTTEFSQTIASTPSAISPLLTAEFRSPDKGTLLGRRSFAFNAAQLDAYTADEMKWWKGGRETKGVEVEEAFKCRICEFAEGCTWRAAKVEEGVKKARLRKEERRRSEV